MTKEELKEAIAATITENGQKGITGQALANLLNEIVDAAGEGGSSGANVENVFTLTIKINVDNDYDSSLEPNEVNALIRQKIIENINNSIGCTLRIAVIQEFEEGTEVYPVEVNTYYYVDGMLVLVHADNATSFLNEDGSFTLIEQP